MESNGKYWKVSCHVSMASVHRCITAQLRVESCEESLYLRKTAFGLFRTPFFVVWRALQRCIHQSWCWHLQAAHVAWLQILLSFHVNLIFSYILICSHIFSYILIYSHVLKFLPLDYSNRIPICISSTRQVPQPIWAQDTTACSKVHMATTTKRHGKTFKWTESLAGKEMERTAFSNAL